MTDKHIGPTPILLTSLVSIVFLGLSTTQIVHAAPADTSSESSTTTASTASQSNQATLTTTSGATQSPTSPAPDNSTNDASQASTAVTTVTTTPISDDNTNDSPAPSVPVNSTTQQAQSQSRSLPATSTDATASITFNYTNALTGEKITFSGGWSSIPALYHQPEVTDYTVSTKASDPTTATLTDKDQYVAAINGYTYIGNLATDVPDHFSASDTTVNLEYLPLADVNVNYVDEADPTKILWSYTISAANSFTGDSYKTDYYQIPFPGYTYASASGPASGTFGQTVNSLTDPNPIVVTYYYAKNDTTTADTFNASNLTYLNSFSPADKTATIGSQINTEPQTYAGYQLIASSGLFQGTMPNHAEATYALYLNNAPITVKYVDETTGKVLSTQTLGTTSPSGNYSTTQQAFNGYTFDHVDGTTSGTYDPISRTIIYYYHSTTTAPAPITTTPTTSTITAAPTTSLAPIEFTYVTPEQHVQFVDFQVANVGTPVTDLTAMPIAKLQQAGYELRPINFPSESVVVPGLQEYRIMIQKTHTASTYFQQTSKSATRNLGRLAQKYTQSMPTISTTVASAPTTQFSYAIWTNNLQLTKLSTINNLEITYKNNLERLYHWYARGNGDDDDTSSLAAYFISLNGKINFGIETHSVEA